jgi:hypothetical protein
LKTLRQNSPRISAAVRRRMAKTIRRRSTK